MAIPLTIPSCHLGPLENGGWISLGVKQAVGERRKMCHRESAWQVSFSKTGAGGEHKGAPSWIGSKARTVKINYKTKIFFIKANLHQTKAPPSWWEWMDVWPGTNFRFWDPWNFFFLLRCGRCNADIVLKVLPPPTQQSINECSYTDSGKSLFLFFFSLRR